MKNIFVFQTKIGLVAEMNETNLLRNAALQLNEYLEGKRNSFDLPLNPKGTEFQKKVWAALCDIPYGETRSYKQIAESVGNPKACRAVGMANNKNPIMIFIPCHRVVGSDGSLTGYAGGLDMKEKLLSLEKRKAI
ncbi:MAG: Methylated-DNA--protein-cysteine methyltransferase [Sedimentibacter sp.]|nr:Methylated-DNA--protein-cysteine methyltransferase [Sedimentibacter sp.]